MSRAWMPVTAKSPVIASVPKARLASQPQPSRPLPAHRVGLLGLFSLQAHLDDLAIARPDGDLHQLILLKVIEFQVLTPCQFGFFVGLKLRMLIDAKLHLLAVLVFDYQCVRIRMNIQYPSDKRPRDFERRRGVVPVGLRLARLRATSLR